MPEGTPEDSIKQTWDEHQAELTENFPDKEDPFNNLTDEEIDSALAELKDATAITPEDEQWFAEGPELVAREKELYRKLSALAPVQPNTLSAILEKTGRTQEERKIVAQHLDLLKTNEEYAQLWRIYQNIAGSWELE